MFKGSQKLDDPYLGLSEAVLVNSRQVSDNQICHFNCFITYTTLQKHTVNASWPTMKQEFWRDVVRSLGFSTLKLVDNGRESSSAENSTKRMPSTPGACHSANVSCLTEQM